MSARPLGRSLAVLAAVISAIAIPAIQMTQNIGLTAAEFSSQGDQTLRVAGYAFSIWGLIYFGLTAYAIYQLTMARETPTLRAVAWPSVVAITGCGAWILASAFNQQALTVAIIVASAAVMVAGLRRARAEEAPAFRDKLLIVWPLSLLAGWLTIASAVNILTVLTAQGIIGPDLTWAVIGIAAVLLVGGAVGWALGSPFYLAPIIWGLGGVYVAQQADKPTAAWLAAAAALLLAVEAAATLRKRRL
ncbi:MAG: hypothetical protein KA085_07655 [Phenylobacterium sp.]|uniref:hypothetical protein n=1 Tax=Phenylobacterium sp. TaxID=1871053 RepID=UPI001B7ADB4D|nr:hypothetical protein [Phenylobacterium sp.]MBP7649994.1 hypothetical protein [Phenylobacterium sp.]MBP7815982.1 hypothetical protein [Phenylobacterium sp.]MBP9230584.1 hypothetical protein [Phenylobacterium sp.]MBP9755123.1 hypothetical protein [Phenylobacterium sp.]